MKKILKLVMVILLLLVSACSSESKEEEVEKVLEGALSDRLETMFFAFSVDEAYLISELQGLVPEEGKQFLVINVTVENTEDPENEEAKTLKMMDTDFYLSYTGGEIDALSAYGHDPLVEGELPGEYEVKPGEKMSGKMVFVVPNDQSTFTLKTQDLYTSSEEEGVIEGDVYSITLTPEVKEVVEE